MADPPRTLLLAAGGCAAAFCVVLVMAYGWDEARYVDARALESLFGAGGTNGQTLAHRIVNLGDPASVAILTALLASAALVSGRPRLALFVLVLIAVTSVGCMALKALLAFPRDGVTDISHAAYPSGHTTAAMSLTIGLLLVTPQRLRIVAAAVGLLLVLGVSYSLIAIGSHFPSDVLGAYFFAAATSLLLLAGARTYEARYPAGPGREVARIAAGERTTTIAAVPAAAGAAIAVAPVVGATLMLGPARLLAFAEANTSAIGVAGTLAVAATALIAGAAITVAREA